MPRTPTDYSTTPVIFYRFVCKDSEITFSYVGHTVCFRKRKAGHKQVLIKSDNARHNEKLYCKIRECGGWDNWRMIEIEKRICIDKREAERIEQEWMEKLQSNLNTNKAFITPEQIKEKNRLYSLTHKDHLKEVN
jgi:hypothetical protein